MSAPSGGFAGDLGAFGLADLVQTIALGGRSGRLGARSRAARGEIWFREGAVVHAECGPLSGEPAVYEMLGWTEGDFTVEYGVATDRRSIEREATVLVLDGLRRLDELGAGEDVPVPVVEERKPVRRRRRRRSVAGTVGILAAAVTAVAWIAAAGGGSRPVAPPRGMETVEPNAPLPVPDDALPVPAEDLPRTVPPRPKLPPPASEAIPEEEELASFVSVPVPLEPLPVFASPATGAPAPSASLRLLGKSWVESGGIRVLVDDAVVYARNLSQQRGEFSRALRRMVAAGDERFEVEIPVAAGAREIVVEVDLGEGAGIQRESALVVFQEGTARTLRVTAGKAVGEPVRVRVD